MATPRALMIRLLDTHPWTGPTTLIEARRFHSTLEPLRLTASELHRGDRIARLVALRLEVFLAHWPSPPHAGDLGSFVEDARGLCRHDIPRLRRLCAHAPRQLPAQRSPRLHVATLNTAV